MQTLSHPTKSAFDWCICHKNLPATVHLILEVPLQELICPTPVPDSSMNNGYISDYGQCSVTIRNIGWTGAQPGLNLTFFFKNWLHSFLVLVLMVALLSFGSRELLYIILYIIVREKVTCRYRSSLHWSLALRKQN